MERPYIICHMVTSLDGKITGGYLNKSEYANLIEEYFCIHREYAADGFLCGRITMEGSFPQPQIHVREYEGEPLDRKDHIVGKAEFYAVAVDPRGKLWWDDSSLLDPDDGYDGAQIIEVLTEQVSGAFLAHLRSKGVSYIFSGEKVLDLKSAVGKLKNLFGIEKLLLEGGGAVNGAFLEAGLIDEISLVVVPAAEMSCEAIPLFNTGKLQTGNRVTAPFVLKEAKNLDDGGLWLNYEIESKEESI